MLIELKQKPVKKLPDGLQERSRKLTAKMIRLGSSREDIMTSLNELAQEFNSRKATVQQPVCKRCHLYPKEITEYLELAEMMQTTPNDAVREEEGTYNPKTGWFYCTDCYIKLGQPLGKA